jgi:hypothetical protein
VERGDRGLDLIGTGRAVAHRLVDQREAFGDQGRVPARAILIVEQDRVAVGIEARVRACVLEEHERGEAHDLGLTGEQAEQEPGQADRFLAQLGAIAIAARVTLVEDQVDHRGDDAESLGAFDRARGLERNIGVRDAGLGARDALLHRSLADEECACDLLHRQARDDPQRERDLLGRGQLGVTADEQQAEDVVAIVRAIEPLGERVGGIERAELVFTWQRGLLAAAARGIDRDVAADEDQPRRRVARWTVLRPRFERAQARVLIRLLGEIEVAEVANQRAERLGTRRRQRGVDPGEVGHARSPGRNTLSGRSSNAPAEPLAFARSLATAIASSSAAHSTM